MQIKVSFVLSSKSMPLSEKPIKVKTAGKFYSATLSQEECFFSSYLSPFARLIISNGYPINCFAWPANFHIC